jgi:hypothetical protein
VGAPKLYDSRALQLMMDELAKSLRNTSFVDPKALANALGNVQGFNSTDLSQQFAANGAVGPGAASVFAGNAGSAAPPVASSGTSPSTPITINVSPTLSTGTSAAAPATSASAGSPTGPQAPGLPTLQTPPAYNPNFGPNGGDLLADETNLTYQLFNLQMMLQRALSDRLYQHAARRQAVLGFDIDIEPSSRARDAAAVVDVTVRLECRGIAGCDASKGMSIVALMPEEGSHNAATLSQKATGFGGALASAVFSVGYSMQKRSQVFYLYRDMDTVSVEPAGNATEAHFGWQFRPVLGRRTVAAGKRHLLVVLALPTPDEAAKEPQAPELVVTTNTSWVYYDRKLQTTHDSNWLSRSLPEPFSYKPPFNVEVPSTASSQDDLKAEITHVDWVPTDPGNGVAILSGRNFFSGTTVRFGNKTYSGSADGLVIKSDQTLEVSLPSAAAAMGGVLSGRYGPAKQIETDEAPPQGFRIDSLYATPIGAFLYAVDVTMVTRTGGQCNCQPAWDSIVSKLNPAVVMVNGLPLNVRPSLTHGPVTNPEEAHLLFQAPAEAFSKATLLTVTFPFAGRIWSQTMPYYKTTLAVTRLAGTPHSRLVISSSNPGDNLCDKAWTLMLDPDHTYTSPDAQLTCVGAGSKTLGFDIDSDTLSKYKRLVLTKNNLVLEAEIPKADAPSPEPVVDKTPAVTVQQYSITTVTFTGKYLDKVTKVMFDKTALEIVKKEAKTLVVSLSKDVTEKPRAVVQLQLLTDGNDPVLATLTVTPAPEPKGK